MVLKKSAEDTKTVELVTDMSRVLWLRVPETEKALFCVLGVQPVPNMLKHWWSINDVAELDNAGGVHEGIAYVAVKQGRAIYMPSSTASELGEAVPFVGDEPMLYLTLGVGSVSGFSGAATINTNPKLKYTFMGSNSGGTEYRSWSSVVTREEIIQTILDGRAALGDLVNKPEYFNAWRVQENHVSPTLLDQVKEETSAIKHLCDGYPELYQLK
jgi:hypothetical protein